MTQRQPDRHCPDELSVVEAQDGSTARSVGDFHVPFPILPWAFWLKFFMTFGFAHSWPAVSMTAQPCSFSAAARGPMPQWWPNVFEPVHTRTLLDWSQRGNLESALKVSRGRAEPAPPGTEPTPVPLTSVLAEPKLPVQGVHTSRCSAMTKIPTPLSSRRKRTSSTESELPQKFDDVMKVFLEECDGFASTEGQRHSPRRQSERGLSRVC